MTTRLSKLHFTALRLGAVFLAFACILSSAPDALAFSLSSGQLIKGSGPAVYYYFQNNTRLVFPNENIFKTWYADFLSVTQISDSDLSAISLGGNVTYRPGARLGKIQTDPKGYAVGRKGVLRWLQSE